MAVHVDVVVVVIDRLDEMLSFIHFVGMLVGSCFKPSSTRNLNPDVVRAFVFCIAGPGAFVRLPLS